MAITRVGAITTLEGAAERTSLEAAKSLIAGLEPQDIIIVQPWAQVNGKKFTLEKAGGEITAQAQVSTNWRTAWFWVKASEISNIKVTWEGSEKKLCTCLIEAYRGVDLTNPIDVTTAAQIFNVAEPEVEGITIVTAGALRIITAVNNAVSENIKTAPTGWTKGTNGSPGLIFKNETSSTGATGIQKVTSNTSSTQRWLHFALRPASESKSVTIEPPAAIAKAIGAIPTIAAGTDVTISPPPAIAKAVAAAPAVSTTQSVTISPPAAVAKALAPAPAVTAEKNEPVSVVRRPSRKPPIELDVEIETAEGAVFRLSADDPKAVNRPTGINFTTQRGEGYATGSFTLNREIFKDYPDLNLMDTVRFVGRQGDIAYEGRVLSLPRDKGQEGETITINLVGWMSYLKGRPMAALIMDRRVAGWEDPSTQRQATMAAGGEYLKGSNSAGFQYEGAAGPGIVQRLDRMVTIEGSTSNSVETWFYAGGELIGELLYLGTVLHGMTFNPLWETQALLSTDDLGSSVTHGTDHHGASSSFSSVVAEGGDKRWAMMKIRWKGTISEDGEWSWLWSYPTVIGDHGLTLRGSAPQQGYYLTDVAQYLLSRYRPKVEWAGETNTFIVEQATWHDSPSNPYDAIQQLNNLVLWETNVWEERKLYFEPADLTKTDWQFKTTDPGVSVNFQGDSIENFANGCVITYKDFFGHTFRLEPTDHPELRDENDNNPANRHGEENWIEKTVPWLCLEAEALQFGRTQLGDYNRPKRPGSFTFSGGYVKDGAGHWRQGWQVRNSQTSSVMDHPLESEPRLNYATTWDQDSLTLTIQVDGLPMTTDAIQARQELALQAHGLSS